MALKLKAAVLAQFVINNNEVREMMIFLSTDKIYKRMKIINPDNIYS